MTSEKLEGFRTQLLELSRRLRVEIALQDQRVATSAGGLPVGNFPNAPLLRADLGMTVYMQERDVTLRENRAQLCNLVLGALSRLEHGTFGACERCGRSILEDRLELLPYTPYCTTCSADIQSGKSIRLDAGKRQRPLEPPSSIVDEPGERYPALKGS